MENAFKCCIYQQGFLPHEMGKQPFEEEDDHSPTTPVPAEADATAAKKMSYRRRANQKKSQPRSRREARELWHLTHLTHLPRYCQGS